MCGIVGYTGPKQAAPILLKGLEHLEYRGYDSSGMAVVNENGIDTLKCRGRLKNLELLSQNGENPKGNMGIGHTRWATHGQPSDVNSHPHASKSGKFVVVHNGIIENYLELKRFLNESGYEFKSQTDTEVVAQLLEYYDEGNILDTVRKVINKLSGSYALGILCSCSPNTFYAIRKDSPLVIGLGVNENFIASDMPAVLEHTRSFVLLEDNIIAKVEPSAVTLFNKNLEQVPYEKFEVDWDIKCAEKDGYPHFMLKEIYEQPKALQNTILPRVKGDEIVLDKISLSDEQIKNLQRINIVACGSAYHAGMIGKYFIERNCRIPVEIDVASEFRYRKPIVGDKTLTVIISQSGETADTLAALREAKKLGSRTLGIVNVVGSSIAREADDVLYTWAGPEIAVATTKGYTTQVAAIYLLGLFLAKKLGTITEELYLQYLNELKSLPEKVKEVIANVEQIQYLASQNFGMNEAFFIGRGTDYALALEGALKLKEISYIHAESYAAGELKHGTISLIEEGSLVFAIAAGNELFEKTLSNIKEVKTRGAKVIALAKKGNADIHNEADAVIELPCLSDEMMPCVAVTALQLMSYYIAAARGCDIDKPRNLAKSVTVE